LDWRTPAEALNDYLKSAAYAVLRRPVESTPYVSIRYTERLAQAGIEPAVGSKGDSLRHPPRIAGLPQGPRLQPSRFDGGMSKHRASHVSENALMRRRGRLDDLDFSIDRDSGPAAVDVSNQPQQARR
jgi:hypothetical protein